MNEEMLNLMRQQVACARETRSWMRFFGILTIASLSIGALATLLIMFEAM